MYGLLAIEWAQTGLITYVAFDVFVYNFGDTESLTKIYYGWLLVDVMCAIVSVTVQLFFVWRIYVLARSPFVAGVITLVCHSTVPLCPAYDTDHCSRAGSFHYSKDLLALHWAYW